MASPKILIVDDEIIIARELEARIQNLGYNVLEIASSGQEAISVAEKTKPDLVLMDIVLKGNMNGIETAASMGKIWNFPIIYLTAYTDEETLKRAKETRPYGYIVKPFSEPELRANIEMALYKHQTEMKLRKTEEQLRQSQKMEALGHLASGIAHDFNNQLTVVTGCSDLLLQTLLEHDTNRELIEEIYEAGQRAAKLTRQLLIFSRKQIIEPKIIDLNSIVGESKKIFQRVIEENIDLVYSLTSDSTTIIADPSHIEQVLMNLVINGRDAMIQGGKLTIETHLVDLDESYTESHWEVKPGRYVMLAINDTGCGMDKSIQEHIFEPFFTTKPPDKGTGLGLSTVYGIVKQCGGYVWVYSEKGFGTTFKIYFPFISEKPDLKEVPKAPAISLRGNETILVIEDESMVRNIVRRVLLSYGYHVIEASGGKEGIKICEQYPQRIHLLITDVIMPEMSGRQTAEQIVSIMPEIKVLFISGYTDDAVIRHGVLKSEMAFLQKPFTTETLTKKVRELLDQQFNNFL